MEASSSAAEKHNIYCTVCTEVFRSPRFLPCHHSFCLSCLEKLANKHGNVITCPNCRKPANLPPGGVKNLQRNFYLSEEELEFARSAGSDAMCPVHPELGVTLHCSQCDLNLCSMCKTAYHEGHVVEELSQLATRSKEAIGRELRRLEDYIRSLTEKTQMFQGNEKRARQARAKVHEQVRIYPNILLNSNF
ncbi:hypothetical protein C0Q70_03454 [Pomacea canaliculata]|uniref:RING-type domain-containing protein n=1 Tax=Pomacea canaliculata TaxID=400727 RepID=A0A2T7PSV2_POMCA|nr:hypothetical protein C0Q70_03454 [Pomacea canaliculata]